MTLWEFIQENGVAETARKICSIYGQDIITNQLARNWFTKFRSGDLTFENKPKPEHSLDIDEDALRTFIKNNPRIKNNLSTGELAKELNTS